MQIDIINVISTAVIAFVTVLGSMFGFFYGLKNEGVSLLSRLVFELVFIIALWQFILWIRGDLYVKKE